jgi:tetratricopeptide (TPR) repeat protein
MPIVRLFLLMLVVLPPATASAQAPEADLQAGFSALQQRDGDTAAAAFRRALRADPNDPAALYGAGAAAYLQGNERDAMALLKRALQAEPRLVHASALLGEIAYHQGDLSLAIKAYESALAHAPGDVFLRERLAAWKSEAAVHDGLVAYKDDRFTILFSGPANETLAARATAVLRDAFWRIGGTLGAYPSNPLNVVFYTDKQFRDITGAPEWAGAGFDGQIRMPVRGAAENLQEFDRILIHELTHAMVSTMAARNVPAWLHEGLAMHFEGHDAAASERRLAASRAFVPLRHLEGGYSRLSATQADLAYELSAFATSALLTRIGPGNLGVLLQALDRGQTIDAAVQQFGLTFADFERELAARVGARATQPE